MDCLTFRLIVSDSGRTGALNLPLGDIPTQIAGPLDVDRALSERISYFHASARLPSE